MKPKPENEASITAKKNRSKRIFISTGEVSGDLQGSLLIEALNRQFLAPGKDLEVKDLESKDLESKDLESKDLEIFALGGDRMAAAGATIWANTTAIGSVGILESLPYILPTLKLQAKIYQYLQQNTPDLVILIDYVGPNLRLGNYIRRHFPQVPIVYYIAPQEWVWSFNHKNTSEIVSICDRLIAIFPEEARYYQAKGAHVTWVGHPLIDQIQGAANREQARAALGINSSQPVIALLPASRRQEIKYLLPVMLAGARAIQEHLPNVQFVIPVSNQIYRQDIEKAIALFKLPAKILTGENNHLGIAAADLAITKSGTVNLEIALLNVPQVVIYRLNPISAWILAKLLKFSIPFMSPVNLVLMKSIVPELLQDQVTPANIVRESLPLLQNTPKRQQILQDYQTMRQALGEIGACDRAAQSILAILAQV